MKAFMMVALATLLGLSNGESMVGVGGWESVDTEATSRSLFNAITSESSYSAVGSKRMCVSTVRAVEQQVVGGMKYRFHVDGCLLNSLQTSGMCPQGCTVQGYMIEVFERAWANMRSITAITPEHIRRA